MEANSNSVQNVQTGKALICEFLLQRVFDYCPLKKQSHLLMLYLVLWIVHRKLIYNSTIDLEIFIVMMLLLMYIYIDLILALSERNFNYYWF